MNFHKYYKRMTSMSYTNIRLHYEVKKVQTITVKCGRQEKKKKKKWKDTK